MVISTSGSIVLIIEKPYIILKMFVLDPVNHKLLLQIYIVIITI